MYNLNFATYVRWCPNYYLKCNSRRYKYIPPWNDFFSIAIVADHRLQSLTSYPQLFEGIADIDFLTPKHSSCFPTHPSPIPNIIQGHIFSERTQGGGGGFTTNASLLTLHLFKSIKMYCCDLQVNYSYELIVGFNDRLAGWMTQL